MTETSELGEPGRPGEKGEKGDDGKPGIMNLTDNRVIFILILVVAVLMYFTWRSDNTATSAKEALNNANMALHNQAVFQYAQCKRSETNTKKINASHAAEIKGLQSFIPPGTDPKDPGLIKFNYYLKIIHESDLVVPTCGKDPNAKTAPTHK